MLSMHTRLSLKSQERTCWRAQCLGETKATSRMRRAADLARVLDGMPQTELMALVDMEPDILSFEPEVLEITISSLAHAFGLKKSQIPSLVSPQRRGDPSILLHPDNAKDNLMGLVRLLGVGRGEVLSLVARVPSLLAITEERLVDKILYLSHLLLASEAKDGGLSDWRLVKEAILKRPEILLIDQNKIKEWLDGISASVSGLLLSSPPSSHLDLARSMALSKPSLLDEEVTEVMSRLEHVIEASGQDIKYVLGIGSDRLAEVLSRPTSSVLIWIDHAATMINAKNDWIGSERGSSRRSREGHQNSTLYRMVLARPSLLSYSVAIIASKRRTLDSMCDLLASSLACSREESLDIISNLSTELMVDILVSSYRPLVKLKYLLVVGSEAASQVKGREQQMVWFEERVSAALHLSDVAFEQAHKKYKAWLQE
jgi:hypothetical protein